MNLNLNLTLVSFVLVDVRLRDWVWGRTKLNKFRPLTKETSRYIKMLVNN